MISFNLTIHQSVLSRQYLNSLSNFNKLVTKQKARMVIRNTYIKKYDPKNCMRQRLNLRLRN